MASIPNVKNATRLSPNQICYIGEKNSSRFLADDEYQGNEEYVKGLAYKMNRDTNLNPVQVVKLPLGDVKGNAGYELVAGYNRWLAAKLIVDGFDYVDPDSGKTIRIHNPSFCLQAIPFVGNDTDRFWANVSDNNDRKPLTCMDIAKIIRDAERMTQASKKEIAIRIDKSPSSISQFKKLLMAPPDIQMILANVNTGPKHWTPAWRTIAKIVDCKKERQQFWFDKIRAGERIGITDIWKGDFGGAEDSDVDDYDIIDILFDKDGGSSTPVVSTSSVADVDDENEDENEDENKPSEDSTPVGEDLPPKKKRGSAKVQMTPKMFRDALDKLNGPKIPSPARDFIDSMINRFLNNSDFSDKKFKTALYKVMSATHTLAIEDLVTQGVLPEPLEPKAMKEMFSRMMDASLVKAEKSE